MVIANSSDFVDRYATMRGRKLANRLSLSGPSSEKLANLVAALAWNLTTLFTCTSDESKRVYGYAVRKCAEEIAENRLYTYMANHRPWHETTKLIGRLLVEVPQAAIADISYTLIREQNDGIAFYG